jgi:hypothetical protein
VPWSKSSSRTRPERFAAGAPTAGAVPSEVWINKPKLVSPTEKARQ